MQSQHGTLSAATVETETFTVTNPQTVTVHVISGSDPIYFTVDGSTPTVAGANTHVVHEGIGAISVKAVISSAGNQLIKMISAGATGFSVVVED